jgi:hypothetical protein
MMKNTEWGAIAYLSLSKYGINEKLNNNNNSNYITGYSSTVSNTQTVYPGTFGTSSSVTLPYNTETGYKASTTGNITGVYDMNGGAHEAVAAYVSGYLSASGFDSDPATFYGNQYFDVYPNGSDVLKYNNRILGDATGEFGPFYHYADNGVYRRHNSWFNDHSHFIISSEYSGMHRGGDYSYGVLAGQLSFDICTGSASTLSFRITLTH